MGGEDGREGGEGRREEQGVAGCASVGPCPGGVPDAATRGALGEGAEEGQRSQGERRSGCGFAGEARGIGGGDTRDGTRDDS